jgi:hypothetical protein
MIAGATTIGVVQNTAAVLTTCLTALPLATLLEFQITAVNEAGESVPSPVSTITLS